MRRADWHSLVLTLCCAACSKQAVAADHPVHAQTATTVASAKTSFAPTDKSIRFSDAAQKVIGIICENDKTLPENRQKIVYVSPDSPGAEAGLNDGDEIISTQLLLDDLKLTVTRHGLPMTLSVRLTEASRKVFDVHPFALQLSQTAMGGVISGGSGTRLSRQSAKVGRDNTGNGALNGAAKTDHLVDASVFRSSPLPVLDVNQPSEKVPVLDVNDPARMLAKFQLELIVDQSMSMAQNNDCPGGYTRWNWCGVQATELARAVAPFEVGGLTITTFNNLFQVHRHAAAQDLVSLFAYPNFHFGTRLAEPLHDRLNEYFSSRNAYSKPLLIAVITDGVPVPKQVEPAMVIQELVRASGQMHNATEVTVVFFQVGGKTRFGQNFLQYLDQNLYREGARYHLVHTVPFEALMRDGLARSLAQSVQTYGRNN
ncbi:MAG: hypothetical protein P4L53_16935 [Candidatus Obscuribacterales bacterium]|nr:hypothetical protein [Candidatus Obscuribacterales bacterium]